jgi:hypothetical protein
MSKESVSNSIFSLLSLSNADLASIICIEFKAVHLLHAAMAFLLLLHQYGLQVRSCSLIDGVLIDNLPPCSSL